LAELLSAEEILPAGDLITGKELRGLLRWFTENGIAYPWGDNPTPYRVWISEIMLQQTVVTAAVGHFTRWMEQFPGIQELAAASEQQVLKAWEGLGYYSRARNILKGAAYLTEKHKGELPDSYEELIRVPGIGDYTARAVLSLAFGKAYPVLDANVRRIAQRIYARREWGKEQDKALLDALDRVIPEDVSADENPGLFNCALMQLGQILCRIKSPDCGRCPLAHSCRARVTGVQCEIPAPKRRAVREKRSVLILLRSGSRYLLQQRRSGIGKGLWFIPSCPPEKEAEIKALLKPEEVLPLKKRTHLYTTWREALEPRLYIADPPPETLLHEIFGEDPLCWVADAELENHPSPSVYRRILEDIPV
jgi:A/G-specific adenine glycosylase